ncbi:MAG TPA: NADH:flavin oxidoreductase/NADH oxidase [Burkholderiaceae bacterium]|nr:NADH:flavin oxidoreductase/NADH oxidase [Burkholderiaceae bacterium]
MSALFEPLQLRGVRLPNRIAISPMSMYSAHDGVASDWHAQHVGKLADGGAGLVMLEVAAVERRGRASHGDLGIWSDAQVPGLRALATRIEAAGAVPAIQIGHAGRKASAQRPWEGFGPLGPDDERARGEAPWTAVGPSALPVSAAWPAPRPLAADELEGIVDAFRQAARRAVAAGFRVVELHAAHGYLLHSFLSPLSNVRDDAWGGARLADRMRLPLAVVRAVREGLGDAVPLSVRISSVDAAEGGWSIEDSVAFARELKALGVDAVDCSSGGISGSATAATDRFAVRRYPGFQVPFAERIRREAGIATIAVGLIAEPRLAESIVAEGRADLVAIGRQALVEPNWPLLAARTLGVDLDWSRWPAQYGWWLARRTGLDASPDGSR